MKLSQYFTEVYLERSHKKRRVEKSLFYPLD